jgi:putative membrane protein insertion efficiency factor
MGFLSAVRDAPRRGLIALVRGYRFFLSPWLGGACRFEPTCSAYALQALQQHGAAAGSLLSLGRLARCHPFCAGGHDPVPAVPPRLFSRLIRPTSKRSSLSSSFREKNTP